MGSRTIRTRARTDPNYTIDGVLTAAHVIGADTATVVETLREYLNLSSVPISHVLGIDASKFTRPTSEPVRAAAAELWSLVRPSASFVTLPDEVPHWERGAACADKGPHLWYCDDDDCEAEAEAVATCASCPVIGHCALAGLFDEDGIWAGLTPRGRRELRRYLRLCVTPATPAGVAPLAAAMAVSAANARSSAKAKPSFDWPDGRLFTLPESTAAQRCKMRRRRRCGAAAATSPLFVC